MARQHWRVKNHTFADFSPKYLNAMAIRAANAFGFVVVKNSNGP
jgi:hypothetical protein